MGEGLGVHFKCGWVCERVCACVPAYVQAECSCHHSRTRTNTLCPPSPPCPPLNTRDARKIPLNWEHRLMLSMAPDYDHLTVIQKVGGGGAGGGALGR